jgi:hypothetical protein
MATERLSMRQTRESLRQKWNLGRTHREVAQSLGISSGTVGATALRGRAAGLDIATAAGWKARSNRLHDVLPGRSTPSRRCTHAKAAMMGTCPGCGGPLKRRQT